MAAHTRGLQILTNLKILFKRFIKIRSLCKTHDFPVSRNWERKPEARLRQFWIASQKIQITARYPKS